MDKNAENLGLTTKEALLTLHHDMEYVLKQFKSSRNSRETKTWLHDAFHHSSQHTTINWISASVIVWIIFTLILSYIIDKRDDLSLILQSFFLILLLLINLYLEFYDNRLRHNELPNKVQSILDKIQKEYDHIDWKCDNYPNLYAPFSPCITLQWTYRDKQLVNLPWSLLVKDDIILLRPGQHSPGYCEAIDKNSDVPLLYAKQIFSPPLQNANEILSTPKCRRPLHNQPYRLLETPYVNNLRVFLEQALDRPITQQNQQRHLIMIRIIERIILPTSFIIVVILDLFKYFYFDGIAKFSDLFLLSPTLTILPLVPLAFPIAWNLLNYLGSARFKLIFNATRMAESVRKEHSFEEDSDETLIVHRKLKYTWRDLLKNFLDILEGHPEMLVRSSNIVHVLGSVTALGCVDKKGILSWPNPTAEKVFFLHNHNTESPASSLGNVNDLSTDMDSTSGTPHHYTFENSNSATGEVLDLTHNHHDPFKLHFDDKEWDKHLPSLKPLGLAILLNTCNIDTQEHYNAFCAHITCEAMYNENLVPITNRRCLCELAKEIGFVDQAQKIFSLEQRLSTFRHLQPEMVRRDNKYARYTLQLSTKLKFPFPHMFAVIVKELSSGSMQLLSEGTADIILDSCIDYWDGNDLCPLNATDRKRIQDFYQRSSLTAYCTAFAYRPLNKCLSEKANERYLELPSDSRHLYMNYRSPTPVHWECKSVLEPKIKTPLGQFFSTDSLLYNDCPSTEVSDAESYFQMQCNQIFIGMVTMQYQALIDMVQLIEQLENACIRFVHFSKENELRSRVFSEKMGLESGWNCHISLLSERGRRESNLANELKQKKSPINNEQRRISQSVKKLVHQTSSNLESSRAMSFSAPSAINLDQPMVKFDTDKEDSSDPSTTYRYVHSTDSVQDTPHTHDWQSLSCLTDSTEQSAPINFDMSNRAKLPRGIDKIRPHIEQIDNVPLLVSLFTDCTSTTIREMLGIMQDYGEIVCILGSSANSENAGIFMKADASIAVNPLYPQVCQKLEVYTKCDTSISPTDLSDALNSIPCSLCVKREEPISLFHLVMESRHYHTILWNAVQFWLTCSIFLCIIQVLNALLMLPLLFTPGQLLWLTCIVLPTLSLSLMGLPVDPEVMKKPQNKNQINFNWNALIFVLWCYGLKFFSTTIIIIGCFGGILMNHCNEFCAMTNCSCEFFYMVDGGWGDDSWTILTARILITFLILLHFVIISMGFVHREHLIVSKLPCNNLWLSTVFILVSVQSIYTIFYYNNLRNVFSEELQYGIPLWLIIIAALSPFFVFLINELIKHQEIMMNRRFQKRARLDFGTKLGMNSPF